MTQEPQKPVVPIRAGNGPCEVKAHRRGKGGSTEETCGRLGYATLRGKTFCRECFDKMKKIVAIAGVCAGREDCMHCGHFPCGCGG